MNTFEQQYLLHLTQKAVAGLPGEDILYAIFTDAITLYKANLLHRFTIYPQMSLKWKPDDKKDRRYEIPDVGIGNYTPPNTNPPFKIRFGVEAKRALAIMSSLPPPNQIKSRHDVEVHFTSVYYQAEDQAKAAFKNSYPFEKSVRWIILIGPYWTIEEFGPFTEAQLTVRYHKVSDSGDFSETVKIEKAREGPPRKIKDLYLLYSRDSYERLGGILDSTDGLAGPLMQGMMVESLSSFQRQF